MTMTGTINFNGTMMLTKIEESKNPKSTYTENTRVMSYISMMFEHKLPKTMIPFFQRFIKPDFRFSSIANKAVEWTYMKNLGSKKEINNIDLVHDQIAVMIEDNGIRVWMPITKNEFIAYYCE